MTFSASASRVDIKQHLVDAHFSESSLYWKKVYESETVQAAIYRERREAVGDVDLHLHGARFDAEDGSGAQVGQK